MSEISSFDARYLKRLMQGILRESKTKNMGVFLCSLNATCSLNPSSWNLRCTVQSYLVELSQGNMNDVTIF